MKVVQIVLVVVISAVLIGTVAEVSRPADADNDLDVFIVAGQSNTYAYSKIDASTAAPVPDSGTGYYFGTSNAPTYNSSMDLSACAMQDLNDNGVARIGGIYPAFAATYNQVTGHKVYLIDTGLSGQTIYTFLPGHSNSQHVKDVVASAMDAIPEGFNVHVKGYIWIQGEGDKNLPIATYEAYMIQLYRAYSGDELSVSLPTCYICKVRERMEGGQLCNASAAQIYLADHVDGFVMATTLADTFTTTNGLMSSDDLHYSQAGCNALATSLGENIGELNKDQKSYDYRELLVIIPVIIAASVAIYVIRNLISRD